MKLDNQLGTGMPSPLDGYTQSRFTFSPQRSLVWKTLTSYLQNRFKINGSVLDIGCGYGDFINNIVSDTRSAMDINANMARFISPGVEFNAAKTADLLTVQKNKKYDWIFSSNLLEHLTRDEITDLLTNCRSLLKKSGHIIFLIPNYRLAYDEYFDDYTHITPISDRSLSDWLVATGYDIVFVHPGFMPFSMRNSRLPIASWLVKLWLHSPFKPNGKQLLIVAKVCEEKGIS